MAATGKLGQRLFDSLSPAGMVHSYAVLGNASQATGMCQAKDQAFKLVPAAM